MWFGKTTLMVLSFKLELVTVETVSPTYGSWTKSGPL